MRYKMILLTPNKYEKMYFDTLHDALEFASTLGKNVNIEIWSDWDTDYACLVYNSAIGG